MADKTAAPKSQPAAPPEHEAVRQANSRQDYWVLAAGVVASLGVTLAIFLTGLLSVLYGESDSLEVAAPVSSLEELLSNVIGFGVVFGVALIVLLAMIRMMRQQVLGNALQVEYSDYAWLREWSNTVARDLRMPQVEIMVAQDPVMNAYAFGFASPYTIVLNSGSIRWLSHEQLKAVVVHEMAHVKYHHTKISAYLNMLTLMPGFGAMNTWLLGFWSRRAELTADRLALCYLRDVDIVKESLIGIHVGPDVAASFNDVARQWQVYMTDNYFNRFTQTFSSHPFLVRRLQHLDSQTAVFAASWQPNEEKTAEETSHKKQAEQ